jgi:RNA polymerase sigma factor (sigma-70 family)
MIPNDQVPEVRGQGTLASDRTTELPQRTLLDRATSGDADAFARLYDVYVDRVYDYLHFHVADDQTADDLTARVFLKAWRSIRCYEADRPAFGEWLYLIARRTVIDFQRGHRGRMPVTEILSPVDKGLGEYEDIKPCPEPQEEGWPKQPRL